MENLKNSYMIMEADLDSGAWLGAGDGPGQEKPDTLLCVTVLGRIKIIHDLNLDSTMQLQLYLTPKQLANVVLSYFGEVRAFRFFRRVLHDLLKKRWQVMTSPVYKKHFDDCEEMKYYKNAA